MTFEEAKRQIKELSDIQMELFDKTSDRKIYGEARAYEEAGHILDDVDTEPVGKDKLTLKELARELRKIFRFKYLTACNKMTGGSPIGLDLFRGYRPWFSSDGYWSISYVVGGGSLVIPVALLSMDLDLSEYADEDGNIDYSKCIVEVE